MKYELIFSPKAEEDLKQLKKSEPKTFQKAIKLINKLINELTIHPKTGTGKPMLKKYDLAGFYARRITDKHRLVYKIDDDKIVVMVVSSKGHYSDK